MKKVFLLPLLLLVFATVQTLRAGYLYDLNETTHRKLVERSHAIVKAKLLSIQEVPVAEHNIDVMLHRYNNDDEGIRRDALLEVTEVFKQDIDASLSTGQLQIVSPLQYAITQYPWSLRQGEEAFFFLEKRVADGRWVVFTDNLGMLSQEDSAGNFTRLEENVRHLTSLYRDFLAEEVTEDLYYAAVQDYLMGELQLDGSRLAYDAMLEFGSSYETFLPHFSEEEKNLLLQRLEASAPDSQERHALLRAVGRIQPEGGMETVIELIANDQGFSTASIGASALELYSRAKGAEMLLERYFEIPQDRPVNRARIITALGILRPKSYRPDEAESRERFTDILRDTLRPESHSLLLEESLLAARDMRYTNNELGFELSELIEAYRENKVNETVCKRVIVALAATRNTEAKAQLLQLKGQFQGRFDQHIELSLLSPFTMLVDGQ